MPNLLSLQLVFAPLRSIPQSFAPWPQLDAFTCDVCPAITSFPAPAAFNVSTISLVSAGLQSCRAIAHKPTGLCRINLRGNNFTCESCPNLATFMWVDAALTYCRYPVQLAPVFRLLAQSGVVAPRTSDVGPFLTDMLARYPNMTAVDARRFGSPPGGRVVVTAPGAVRHTVQLDVGWFLSQLMSLSRFDPWQVASFAVFYRVSVDGTNFIPGVSSQSGGPFSEASAVWSNVSGLVLRCVEPLTGCNVNIPPQFVSGSDAVKLLRAGLTVSLWPARLGVVESPIRLYAHLVPQVPPPEVLKDIGFPIIQPLPESVLISTQLVVQLLALPEGTVVTPRGHAVTPHAITIAIAGAFPSPAPNATCVWSSTAASVAAAAAGAAADVNATAPLREEGGVVSCTQPALPPGAEVDFKVMLDGLNAVKVTQYIVRDFPTADRVSVVSGPASVRADNGAAVFDPIVVAAGDSVGQLWELDSVAAPLGRQINVTALQAGEAVAVVLTTTAVGAADPPVTAKDKVVTRDGSAAVRVKLIAPRPGSVTLAFALAGIRTAALFTVTVAVQYGVPVRVVSLSPTDSFTLSSAAGSVVPLSPPLRLALEDAGGTLVLFRPPAASPTLRLSVAGAAPDAQPWVESAVDDVVGFATFVSAPLAAALSASCATPVDSCVGVAAASVAVAVPSGVRQDVLVSALVPLMVFLACGVVLAGVAYRATRSWRRKRAVRRARLGAIAAETATAAEHAELLRRARACLAAGGSRDVAAQIISAALRADCAGAISALGPRAMAVASRAARVGPAVGLVLAEARTFGGELPNVAVDPASPVVAAVAAAMARHVAAGGAPAGIVAVAAAAGLQLVGVESASLIAEAYSAALAAAADGVAAADEHPPPTPSPKGVAACGHVGHGSGGGATGVARPLASSGVGAGTKHSSGVGGGGVGEAAARNPLGYVPFAPLAIALFAAVRRSSKFEVVSALRAVVESHAAVSAAAAAAAAATSPEPDPLTYTDRLALRLYTVELYAPPPPQPPAALLAVWARRSDSWGTGSTAEQFYAATNRALRTGEGVDNWRPFAFYVEAALRRLPPVTARVYRGINVAYDAAAYARGREVVWHAFSSTSGSSSVAEKFAGSAAGTVFVADVLTARRISAYSAFPDEDELVLLPGARLAVRSAISEAQRSVVGVAAQVLELMQRVDERDVADVPLDELARQVASAREQLGRVRRDYSALVAVARAQHDDLKMARRNCQLAARRISALPSCSRRPSAGDASPPHDMLTAFSLPLLSPLGPLSSPTVPHAPGAASQADSSLQTIPDFEWTRPHDATAAADWYSRFYSPGDDAGADA